MARITVEDCLVHEPNRFHLVLESSARARQLLRGADPVAPRQHHKSTVLSLKEIATGKLDKERLWLTPPPRPRTSPMDSGRGAMSGKAVSSAPREATALEKAESLFSGGAPAEADNDAE
ncbi:MAG: DNA-directed RNA polymerase subunit omega [Alphaproteobacteria bacterium CG_4_10_14_0_2_um_filter_63_37]|nr:MAG: DNA-directed RNA polymerase subunit omega [Proteobacteria bacterium CG1_02_64_396]PJA25748.1 MAG: DNA-directed RNA polymerase subunit omega [Alphaproteobacteria bacterium CG_4_10_14_0_2_um_filter_63_37]